MSIFVLLKFVGISFLPEMDTGSINLEIKRPPGTRLEETDKTFQKAEEIGSRGLGNMVALGFLTSKTGLVSASSMEEAVSRSVGPRYLKQDLKAFRAGLELALEG